MAIALLFGIGALRYEIGQFSRSGPGLFPLMVSTILFICGLVTVVRSYFLEPVLLSYNIKNIAIIVASLGGFALVSEWLNMSVGIVFLVFCATWAGSDYSVKRNLKICVGLLGVAFAFKFLLGLSLPLY